MDGKTEIISQPSRRWQLLSLSLIIPIFLLVAITLLSGRAQALRPTNAISGVVLKPDGLVITSNTTVKLYLPDDWGGCCRWITETDAPAGSGTFDFSLDTIPPEYIPNYFYIEADGDCAPYCHSLPTVISVTSTALPVDAGPVTLTYPSFTGTVLEPDGTTPTDGDVVVRAWKDGVWQDVAWATTYSSTYKVGGVPAGSLMLEAIPMDNSLFWNSEPVSVSVAPGSQYVSTATQTYDLILQSPNITGTVVYPDGSPVTWIMSGTDPIGRAWVDAYTPTLDYPLVRPTTSWGGFGFLLLTGTYNLRAGPDGVQQMTYTASIPKGVAVPTVTNAGALTLTYPSFTGMVYDDSGQPIDGCVEVRLEDPAHTTATADWFCTQDRPMYMLGGVIGGDYLLLADPAGWPGFQPSDPITVHIAPGSQYNLTATQVISLYLKSTQLSVLAYDPESTAIGAHVEVWDEWGNWDWADTWPGAPALFSNLPPGEYSVQAWPLDEDVPALANSMVERVNLDGAAPVDLALSLQYPDVIGEVRLPDSAPLPPAYDGGKPVPPASFHVHDANWASCNCMYLAIVNSYCH